MLMARLDSPGSAGYAPSRTNYAGTALTPEQKITGPEAANNGARQSIPVPTVPKPPNPAVGGMMGQSRVLGWTTGLREPRAYRQQFTGRTLVVPSMGAHPNIGPVGRDAARNQRLANGVAALSANYSQDNASVANMLSPASFNPLLRDM